MTSAAGTPDSTVTSEAAGAGPTPPVGLGDNPVVDIYELSPLQQGMLLHSVHDSAADMYLGQQVYEVTGPLDLDLLCAAWNAVTEAEPVLRTSFDWGAELDRPLQVVRSHADLPVERLDWRQLGDEERSARLTALLDRDRSTAFDLSRPGQQRLHLLVYGEEVVRVVWTYHHIVIDGWSVPLIMDDILAHYRSLVGLGQQPAPRPPFRDYIAWLHHRSDDADREFWTSRLDGCEPSRLQVLRTAGADAPGDVERRVVAIPPDVVAGLDDVASRHRVTFGTLATAAWAAVASRLTARDDVIVGQPASGRPAALPQVGSMIGMFANTLPVRVVLRETDELGQWLRTLQRDNAEMRRHEATPLSRIQGWVGLPGRMLFDTLVSIEPTRLEPGASGGGAAADVTVRRVRLHDKISLPLAITVAGPPTSEVHLLVHHERFAPGISDDVLDRFFGALRALGAARTVGDLVTGAGEAVEPRPLPVADLDTDDPDAGQPVDDSLVENIQAVYGEVLETSAPDPDASFFELGGDSFAAVRAVGRIEGATLSLLATHPSARRLAAAISASGAGSGARPVTVVDREGPLLPMIGQAGLWFSAMVVPESTSFHVPVAARVHGPLDLAALERALTVLSGRHESLRTRFEAPDGDPRVVLNVVADHVTVPVEGIRARDVSEWTVRVCAEPFDLARGPLFRVRLARIGVDDHVLAVVAHHTVADGWSMQILMRELTALYEEARTGLPAVLEPLAVQPVDVAAWQRDWLASPDGTAQLDHWIERLDDLPTIDLPTDRRRSETPTYGGETVGLILPRSISRAATELAQAQGVSMLAVLQAAVLTTLHAHTGQTDLPLGSLFAGRTRPETEPLVGYFANSVVLRTSAAGDPTFSELVERCHETVQDALEHQAVPFPSVVRAIGPSRVVGRHPLFQVDLTLLPQQLAGAGQGLGEATLTPVPDEDHFCQFDLGFEIAYLDDDTLTLGLEYATDLFDAATVRRLARHFVQALRQGTAHPGTPLGQLSIMGRGDARRVAARRAGSRTAVDASADPARLGSGSDELVRSIAAEASLLLSVDLSADDDFFDHGADSLFATMLLAGLERRLGQSAHPNAVVAAPTARALSGLVAERRCVVAVRPGHHRRRPGTVGRVLRSGVASLSAKVRTRPRLVRVVRALRELRWAARCKLAGLV